jgi:hypothetical protein
MYIVTQPASARYSGQRSLIQPKLPHPTPTPTPTPTSMTPTSIIASLHLDPYCRVRDISQPAIFNTKRGMNIQPYLPLPIKSQNRFAITILRSVQISKA